jgi:hypothetical protein
MNTTFNNNPFGGAFGGGPKGGVDYMQLFFAPTIAYKFNQNHSIGATLNVVYHQFGAQGLEGFQGFSATPGSVTNRGRDDATGASLRLGWTGKITPAITLGATYQTKTKMGQRPVPQRRRARCTGELRHRHRRGRDAETEDRRGHPADQLCQDGLGRHAGGLLFRRHLLSRRGERPRLRLA